MKKLVRGTAALALFMACAWGQTPSLESPGAYCRISASEWVKLAPARPKDTKTAGMGRFLENEGLTNLNVLYVYAGPQAALQVQDPTPVFQICISDSSRESALIVELAKKKDGREIEATHDATTSQNKMGYRKSVIHQVTTNPAGPGCYTATPDEPLKPGEYLLTLGTPENTFDFGIKRGAVKH
jgi:hypothetical protein